MLCGMLAVMLPSNVLRRDTMVNIRFIVGCCWWVFLARWIELKFCFFSTDWFALKLVVLVVVLTCTHLYSIVLYFFLVHIYKLLHSGYSHVLICATYLNVWYFHSLELIYSSMYRRRRLTSGSRTSFAWATLSSWGHFSWYSTTKSWWQATVLFEPSSYQWRRTTFSTCSFVTSLAPSCNFVEDFLFKLHAVRATAKVIELEALLSNLPL
jgi:hypothetical protein